MAQPQQKSEGSRASDTGRLEQLLEENLAATREIQTTMEKFNRWLVWQRVWLVIKILIIMTPIVLGVLYLPSLINRVFEPYQQLLNVGQTLEEAATANPLPDAN